MVSVVDICNLALAAIGARSTISSLDEGSTEADQCSLMYEPTRDDLLRMANWNFARAQVLLTEIGNSTDGTSLVPWDYEYAYPSDCLRIRFLMPTYRDANNNVIAARNYQGPIIRFLESSDLDGSSNRIKVLLTDQPEALAIYTTRITDPLLFDPQFITAFANSLGARMAIPLNGDKVMARDAKATALATVRLAQVSDGNEGLTIQEYTPDWMQVRGYQSDYAGYAACSGIPSYLLN